MPTIEKETIPQSNWIRRLIGVGGFLLLLAGCGWGAWYYLWMPDVRTERLMNEARRARAKGQNRQAERSAAEALEFDPSLEQAAFFAAECATEQKSYLRALDYLEKLQTTDRETLFRVALYAAELQHHQLDRLADAEQSYRKALEFDSENIKANSGLARLLGMCGRRQEAIPHVLKLIRQGEETDLLMLIARDSGMINDPEALERARLSDPNDANPLLGLAKHAAAIEQTDLAIQLLRDAIKKQPDFSAAHVTLGQQLLLANRLNELVNWEKQIPSAAENISETWLVRAQVAEKSGLKKEAMRCYWEALKRAPESKLSNFRFARLLTETGATEVAEKFTQHLRLLQELETVQNRYLISSGHATVDPALELATSYKKVGRYWEAYFWCLLAARYDPNHEQARRYLREMKSKINGIPLRLTTDSANIALLVDFSSYPLPAIIESNDPSSDKSPVIPSKISFQNDAASVGLNFRYFNGTSGPPTHRMFEFTGGGIGVIDFDLDGFPDTFLTQGRVWDSDSPRGNYDDQLFHNNGGNRYDNVTISAGVQETGFGQGITTGDVNADGFPDLFVANIGSNQLWLNNGDGTFSDSTSEAGIQGEAWTTSCVLADFDGDALPDIYAVNYVTAPDVFDRTCPRVDGSPGICLPFHFEGEPDQFWRNDGNGRFTDATAKILPLTSHGKGLGVAVWKSDRSEQLCLLVANDTTPNLFFEKAVSEDGGFRFQERGIASGLALNAEGKSEGCMGIAVGDVNEDGQMDLFITNFLNESNTLYLNTADGYYEDRTREESLHSASMDNVGFGTQFLDADLDSRFELFVANGHVDDLRQLNRPYKMLPQFFRWDGVRPSELKGTDLGTYFLKKRLGRAVARIDWNRDGREDLLVGHLYDDTALLTNTTLQTGRFLSLKLFGVESNRDAVGTTVQVRIHNRTIIRQLTAGDGYQASNERRLIIGVGDAQKIDELIVHWPSGKVQQFENVAVSQEAWLPEGGKLFSNPSHRLTHLANEL